MNEEKLLENIGHVKEEFIEEAAPKGLLEQQQSVSKGNGARNYSWIKWGALAACLCILAGLGVKILPIFETSEDNKAVDINTAGQLMAEDNSISDFVQPQTFSANTSKANTESLPVVKPEEDVDGNIDTAFTVDEGFPNWGLTLSVKNVSATGLTLVCTHSGGALTGELETGEPYLLITLTDGTWKTVEELPLPEGVDGRAWNSLAYWIPKDGSREFEINWEWIYGELPAGTYRLIKGFMDFRGTADYDSFDYWVEFEIQ